MVRHYADHHATENDHDLVFPTSTGRRQTPENWRNRGFFAACFEAGLVVKDKVKGEVVEKPKYVPYHLRHFYASVLIAKEPLQKPSASDRDIIRGGVDWRA
jgi:integrase